MVERLCGINRDARCSDIDGEKKYGIDGYLECDEY